MIFKNQQQGSFLSVFLIFLSSTISLSERELLISKFVGPLKWEIIFSHKDKIARFTFFPFKALVSKKRKLFSLAKDFPYSSLTILFWSASSNLFPINTIGI